MSDADLNFPQNSYNEAQIDEVKQAPVSEFLATLHKFGAIGERRTSR